MRQEHKNHILKLKQIADHYKAIKIFQGYRFYMNDVIAVKKMIEIHKISEANIRKAIISVLSPCDGEHHARVCIWEARKIIYKIEPKAYSPFVKVTCGNIVSWKKVIGQMDVGGAARCERCDKLEEIIEVY